MELSRSRPRALLSWSSGKDAAWALHTVQRADQFDIRGLITTLNGEANRVAMHGVRRALLERQAGAVGLPLCVVDLPVPCSNDEYQSRLAVALERLKREQGITHVIFGDLLLEDVRAYRESQLAALGLEPVFPLFGRGTAQLAREMIDGGLRARLTCVDATQLDPAFSGRSFDHELLAALPPATDPCGENGEFHTLVTAGPMFRNQIQVRQGDCHDDGRFYFVDFLPASD